MKKKTLGKWLAVAFSTLALFILISTLAGCGDGGMDVNASVTSTFKPVNNQASGTFVVNNGPAGKFTVILTVLFFDGSNKMIQKEEVTIWKDVTLDEVKGKSVPWRTPVLPAELKPVRFEARWRGE